MWYIANGTIGKSSSSAAVAEPNYSSAAYQWQSRHYHCPHRTLHASPLQTTASTDGANYGALHQHDIQSRLSTHYDSSKLSMDCKDILADNVCRLPVSRTIPDRRELAPRLRYRSELYTGWSNRSRYKKQARSMNLW